MTHAIKILETFADAVANGEKTFEVRENDRNYQKDDLIVFHVITDFADSPRNCRHFSPDSHPLNKMVFKITYVLSGWGIKDGWVVFGIKEVSGKDCRDCKKWNDCECGKKGHENGTSIGYSIGECKEFEVNEVKGDKE